VAKVFSTAVFALKIKSVLKSVRRKSDQKMALGISGFGLGFEPCMV
jgi:hypothetical protein